MVPTRRRYSGGMDQRRELLRHTVAALAYRANRALDGSTEEFANFDGAGRTPGRILAHMGDLFDWALACARGDERWRNSKPGAWEEERQRFFSALTALDSYLAGAEPLHGEMERLFQGPIADALTHVGQLAMLRRLAGSATRGENFYLANIVAGQTGADQPAQVAPF